MSQTHPLPTSTITPSPQRFINLSLFLLVAITNNIPYQSLTGIAPTISSLYQVSALQVNINEIFFAITYIALIFPYNYLIDVKGLKVGTLICQGLMILGLVMRCFVNVSFYFVMVGSFFCALGYSAVISAANRFPNVWFLDKEILPVKALVLFCLFTSDVLGIYLSSAFIKQDSTKNDVQQFFIYQGGIIIIFNLLNMLFFKGTPQTPQNYASQISHSSQPYLQSLKKLFTNKNYMKLFMVMTFVDTSVDGSFVCFSWMGEVYQISTSNCAYIFVIANATGLIGCGLIGFIMPEKYRQKCKWLASLAVVSFVIVWVGFENSSLWVIYLGAALLGLNLLPFMMTLTDFSAQTAFPIGQGTSGGTFVFGSSILGFLMVILFSLYINDSVTTQKCRVTMGVLLVFQIASILFLISSKQDLKRSQYEQGMKNEQKASLISEKYIFEK